MKKLLLTFFVVLCFAFVSFAAEILLEEPVIVTSAGQSPGALQFTVVAKMVSLAYKFDKLYKAEDVDMSQFKTFVIVVGASGKGLGAAGIDIEVEINRVLALAREAKDNGLKIVICNLEGASRRGESSDKIVTTLAPLASVYFVKSDANEDGFFTNLSEEAGVPMATFEMTVGLKDVLAQYFGK